MMQKIVSGTDIHILACLCVLIIINIKMQGNVGFVKNRQIIIYNVSENNLH